MIEIIKIEDEGIWLDERHKVLTSTEVSALYGLSPYKTKFELFHEKLNPVERLEQTEYMKWGNRLESVIAEAVAETEGLKIEKANVFIVDRKERIGSSFDYFIDDGRILEIKNVRDVVFHRSWCDKNGEIAPPMHIMLQVQFQMMLKGVSEGLVGALVGGNTLKVIRVAADSKVQESMRRKAKEFWDAVDNNTPPQMTEEEQQEKDAEDAAGLIPNQEEVVVANDEMEEMVRTYMSLKETIKAATSAADILRTRIELAAGTAGTIQGVNWKATIGMTKPSPGTLVTEDMVGLTIGGRAGFKTVRIKEFK
jgi:putative phage-type endonuclease